jgi:hypothetical protein
MLKFVKQLDSSDMDQFVIVGKNSCLVQKNGELKTKIFKSLGVHAVEHQNYGHYDLYVQIAYTNGKKEIVVEYGLSKSDLGKLLVEISRHGSIAPMPL